MAAAPQPTPGKFTVLYFAGASSFTRKKQASYEAPMTLPRFFALLEEEHHGITAAVLNSSAVTVNLEYVDLEEERQKGDGGLVIQAGDEVAVIPPVSSG